MFGCRISVDGGPGHGRPEKSHVGPVSDFFKNYSCYHTAVKNHVLKCPECGVDPMLQRWLDLRDSRNGGFVSTGLLTMALRTERGCLRKKERALGKTCDRSLVNRFVVRSHPADVVENEGRLSDDETVEAVRWTWRRWEAEKKSDPAFKAFEWTRSQTPRPSVMAAPRFRWMLSTASMRFDVRGQFPDEEVMKREAAVAEVMLG